MLDTRGNLNLGEGECLTVRLKSSGYTAIFNGRRVRLVGKLRGFHYMPTVRRNRWCYWNSCPMCEAGHPRIVRFETTLLWERPIGLEERKAYLTRHVHRLFAQLATVIEASGRDPRDVRLYWRHKVGTARTVEVGFLA